MKRAVSGVQPSGSCQTYAWDIDGYCLMNPGISTPIPHVALMDPIDQTLVTSPLPTFAGLAAMCRVHVVRQRA